MITNKDIDATNKYVDEIGAMFNDDMHGFRSEVYILVSRIRAESAEQARKEECIITLEEVRNICLIETSITTDDIDHLIEQAKSKETKQ